jgi:hypothetical protein
MRVYRWCVATEYGASASIDQTVRAVAPGEAANQQPAVIVLSSLHIFHRGMTESFGVAFMPATCASMEALTKTGASSCGHCRVPPDRCRNAGGHVRDGRAPAATRGHAHGPYENTRAWGSRVMDAGGPPRGWTIMANDTQLSEQKAMEPSQLERGFVSDGRFQVIDRRTRAVVCLQSSSVGMRVVRGRLLGLSIHAVRAPLRFPVGHLPGMPPIRRCLCGHAP